MLRSNIRLVFHQRRPGIIKSSSRLLPISWLLGRFPSDVSFFVRLLATDSANVFVSETVSNCRPSSAFNVCSNKHYCCSMAYFRGTIAPHSMSSSSSVIHQPIQRLCKKEGNVICIRAPPTLSRDLSLILWYGIYARQNALKTRFELLPDPTPRKSVYPACPSYRAAAWTAHYRYDLLCYYYSPFCMRCVGCLKKVRWQGGWQVQIQNQKNRQEKLSFTERAEIVQKWWDEYTSFNFSVLAYF